ncbi:MAG: efflux RND transporter periplasmic adaptor subunit [Odoribacter sp.]|nr:efflux RND transporter periplasmic adaptor subunit [Odoribacter sp.]
MKIKNWIIGIILLALVGFGVYYFFFRNKAAKGFVWETEVAGANVITEMISATGTLEPITVVEVGTQVSGIIDRIYVDYNSEVTKGQLIAELDQTTLASDLTSSQATLEASRIQFDYQKRNYERLKLLHDKQLISDTEFEDALYNYETAQTTYQRNRADLVKVQTNLGYAKIYSPIDGVVISKAVEEGQTVAASFSTPTLFTIANDLTKMQVIANVDEADIGGVREGQRVTFKVDAFPMDIFDGEVTQVRLEATTESSVVTYETVINAPNPDLKLKPGMTATVTIYTLEQEAPITVSTRALQFDPQVLASRNKTQLEPLNSRSTSSVWIKEEEVLREVAVNTGLANRYLTEITSGLADGQQVVIGIKNIQAEEDEWGNGGNGNGNGNGSSGTQSPFTPQRPRR